VKNQKPNVVSVQETVTKIMTVARAWYASKERRMSQSLVAQGPLRTVLTTASYQQLMMLDQLDNAKSKMASADSVRETATQMLLVFQD
jgi:hypothetical protein